MNLQRSGADDSLVQSRNDYRGQVIEKSVRGELALFHQRQDLACVLGMRSFDLGRRFDAVTCLFSSIGYLLTPEDLEQGIARMAAHVAPGGVLVVEPWFTPDAWRPGSLPASRYVASSERSMSR